MKARNYCLTLIAALMIFAMPSMARVGNYLRSVSSGEDFHQEHVQQVQRFGFQAGHQRRLG